MPFLGLECLECYYFWFLYLFLLLTCMHVFYHSIYLTVLILVALCSLNCMHLAMVYLILLTECFAFH